MIDILSTNAFVFTNLKSKKKIVNIRYWLSKNHMKLPLCSQHDQHVEHIKVKFILVLKTGRG